MAIRARASLREAALFSAVAALGLSLPAQRAESTEIAHYEIFFELEAEVRSRRFDADIEAAARLEMRSARTPGGGHVLSLERALRPATKFYAVDPAGPFGDEVKMAAVATLAEGSWEALAQARREVDELAEAAYERWSQRTESDRGFDGAFTFIVIGPPRDRFRVELTADGRITEIENRLTDHWLAGPFDRFLERWRGEVGSLAREPPAREHPSSAGYWFWNQGEAEPFDYEPHVYHALAGALELLRQPMPEAGTPLEWAELPAHLLGVLTTLAPKAERRLEPTLEPATLELVEPGLAQTQTGTAVRVVIRRGEGASTLEARWSASGLRLQLRVGYAPRAMGSHSPSTAQPR